MLQNTAPLPVLARFSSLGILLDRVATACQEAGLDNDTRKRAELAVEELFANTINHAYGGESDRPVWLHVLVTPDGIKIDYQDSGPTFAPFASQDVHVENPSHKTTAGGFGISLINTMPNTRAYSRQDGHNVILLEFCRNT